MEVHVAGFAQHDTLARPCRDHFPTQRRDLHISHLVDVMHLTCLILGTAQLALIGVETFDKLGTVEAPHCCGGNDVDRSVADFSNRQLGRLPQFGRLGLSPDHVADLIIGSTPKPIEDLHHRTLMLVG